ncbi:U3 small nucleolar RNA-associated protein 18 like protein [Ditylenchus destructor]|nr:U3 small nucleolar RNA-associated protein 18 like protein [Ditylenchus destructor]
MSRRNIVMRTPKWARLDDETQKQEADINQGSDDEDEANALSALHEMTRSTGKYISKSKTLSKYHIASNLLKDITIGHNKNGAITSVKFHPAKPVLVTASNNGTLSLFELLEGQNMELKKSEHFLQDVTFSNFRISSVDFCDNGLSLLAHSDNKNYSYSYDLVEGKVSQIRVPQEFRDLQSVKAAVSADGIFIARQLGISDLSIFVLKTMEHLHTFRAHNQLVDFSFSTADRNIIYALAEDGSVYTWDLKDRSNQTYFMDEGCVKASCLATSANGQFLACGSNTGVINVYESSKIAQSTEKHNDYDRKSVKPLYTLGNLTTSASVIKFNHDAQTMAFASNVKYMAGRMLHVKSGEVFQNFPSRQEMFAKTRLKCCDFSPSSGFFVFGEQSGGCRLYRMNYFSKY